MIQRDKGESAGVLAKETQVWEKSFLLSTMNPFFGLQFTCERDIIDKCLNLCFNRYEKLR